jgi:hypothetical protein
MAVAALHTTKQIWGDGRQARRCCAPPARQYAQEDDGNDDEWPLDRTPLIATPASRKNFPLRHADIRPLKPLKRPSTARVRAWNGGTWDQRGVALLRHPYAAVCSLCLARDAGLIKVIALPCSLGVWLQGINRLD